MSRNAEDLLADLNDLPDDPEAPAGDNATDEASIDEFLAEFSKEREKPTRTMTPRGVAGARSARASPRTVSYTDKSRKSGEGSRASIDSKRSNKDDQTFTNSSASTSDKSEKGEEQEASSTADDKSSATRGNETGPKKVYGSSSAWSSWGGTLWSTANTIQTQLRAEAEKRLAELQASEEAQKLQSRFRELDLAKIDLAKLASEARNLGQGVLDAVAPPIDDNETLVVNVLHDISGLRIETPVYNSFERVMEQVEGGALKVMARDRDGALNLNAAQGTITEAKKMCVAAVEDVIRDAKDEPDNKFSNIYLSIQAFCESSPDVDPESVDQADEPEIQILMSLIDPTNGIKFNSISQSFPASWISLSLVTVEASMQPRQWISEWLQESITLNAGILAQRYVARRMGIDRDNSAGTNLTSSTDNLETEKTHSEAAAADADAPADDSGSDPAPGGMKIKEGQDLSEAGLGL